MVKSTQDSNGAQVTYKDKEINDKRLNMISSKSVFRQLSGHAIRMMKRTCKGYRLSTCDYISFVILLTFLISAADQSLGKGISNHLLLYGGYLYLDDSYPVLFRIILLTLIMFMFYFVCVRYIQQFLLCSLLSYKGWMYQPYSSKSVFVKLWGLLLRLLSHKNPKLYSYQRCLPRMSVPPLKSTMNKLLQSMKPLLDNDEYKNMETEASRFLNTIGPKLQWHLYLKSWWSPNFSTDWWDKYAYLSSRDPIPNSSYGFLDQIKWIPTKHQTSRAAGVTSLLLQFKSFIDSENLKPIMIGGAVPLCMWQYERLFSTTRIPRKDCDDLKHYPESSHIVVLAKGHFYKVDVADSHQKPLNHLDFQRLFDWILEDVCVWEAENNAESRIASLTSNKRSTWANCQREHFMSGVNRGSLDTIEEAIFLVVLDDNRFTDRSERAKYLLHGDGSTLWFDKSFCAVFFTDGRMGLNVEHSWGDGLVMGHLMEYVLTHEYLYRLYDDDGLCQPYDSSSPISSLVPSKSTITPTRIHWDIDDKLEEKINESFIFARNSSDNIDICAKQFDSFGKGLMKKAKINPDAFIQMAFQLAYYKDSGGLFANTYESSMTRLYLHGRTETIRSFTQEVKEYVVAMNDSNVTNAEKFRLIGAAAKKHQEMSRDCMAGKGIDRHLFALYIVSKKKGIESKFLSNILTMPWKLSTSQGPIYQMYQGFDLNIHQIRDASSTGTVFAPVCYDGYGIMYGIIGDSRICFQISSNKSCPTTDSKRFMENLFWAFSEMQIVIDGIRNI